MVASLRALRQTCRIAGDGPSLVPGGAGNFEGLSALALVEPFLAVVRAEEASGAATGAALAALAALLRGGLLDPADDVFASGRPDVAEAASELVDAVSSARFEFTDGPRDEVRFRGG